MSRRHALLTDALISFGLFLLPLAFFWQVTLGSRTLLPADNIYQYPPWSAYRADVGVPDVPHNTLLSDLVLENYPWKQFIRQSIANRELPLWNPFLFAGVPFLAAGQHSALYPFSIIYYVLPLEKAYGWFTVSQLWLAGFLMYLFMRGLGVRRIGAIFASIVYQFSAFYIASVVFQMIIAAAAWLPFLLLMVEFTIQKRALLGRPAVVPWVVLGGIGLGMCILAGHIEFLYYSLLVMGFWSVCRLAGKLLRSEKALTPPKEALTPGPSPEGEGKKEARRFSKERWAEVGRTAAALLALVVIGLGIGAIQIVPLFELASRNFREGSASFETVRGYAYPPRHALEFLMPNLFGSPAEHDYFDVFTGRQTPLQWQRGSDTVTNTYWEVGKNYVEGACYVGILTLVFAVFAFLPHTLAANSPHPPAPAPLAERGSPEHLNTAWRAYKTIFALLAIISLSFMFGTAAYAILYYGLPGVNQLHSPFRWVWPFTLGMAALAGFGADMLSRQALTPALIKRFAFGLIGAGVIILIGLLLSRVFFVQLRAPIEALFHKLAGADTQFPNVETFYSVEFRSILIFGLLLIASGVVVRLSRAPICLPRWLGQRLLWEPLALIVITFDLVAASAGFNPAADPAWLHFEPPAITWLKAHDPQNWRFITVDSGSKPLNANLGWLYGLQDVGGYDSIIPKQYVQYMEQIQPQGMLIYNRIAPLTADRLAPLDSSQLDQLSVRYVVSETEISSPKYKQVFEDRGLRIYENTSALPRVYTSTSLSSPGLHPVVSFAAQSNQISVDVSTWAGDHARFSWLVLNDSHFPGWRAYARPRGAPDEQEKEIPVSLFGDNFRAVQVPPGNWTVRFRYTPQSVQIGAFGSFIAGVIILFALLIWLWQHFYVEGKEATGVGRIAKNSAAPILLSLFNRAIDFAFAVVMLRILSPIDVGAYYYAVVIIGWFDILTNFGLNTLLTRDVARNPAAATSYLRRTSLLRFGFAAVWLPLLGIFILVRQHLIAEPLNSTTLLTLVLLYASLIPSSINNGLSALFYAFEKAEIPAAISTATAILSVVTRLAVLLLGFGIIGLAGASVFLNFITLALLLSQALPLLRRAISPSPNSERGQGGEVNGPDPTSYRTMITESWPLMLNHLLATMFFKLDVTLLEARDKNGAATVAQYSVSYKWVDAIGVIPAFFTMALLPVMSRQAHSDKPGLMRNYQLAVKMLVMVALPIAVVTTFLAPTLVSLLGGARYVQDGTRALQLMIWFIPVGWINSLTQYVLIALNMQRPLRWPFVVGVVFNVVANLLFIPLYSYQAASVVTILSEIVLQIGFYVLLRRSLGAVPWLDLLARPAVAAAIMFGILALLWGTSPVLALLIAGLAYPAALLILRPLSPPEIDRLAPLLPGPLRRFARV